MYFRNFIADIAKFVDILFSEFFECKLRELFGEEIDIESIECHIIHHIDSQLEFVFFKEFTEGLFALVVERWVYYKIEGFKREFSRVIFTGLGEIFKEGKHLSFVFFSQIGLACKEW